MTEAFSSWESKMAPTGINTYNSFELVLSAYSGLTVYSHMKDDPILSELNSLLMEISMYSNASLISDPSASYTPDNVSLYAWIDRYTRIYSKLMNNSLTDIPDFGQYVFSLMQKEDNAFSRLASGRSSSSKSPAAMNPVMHRMVLADLDRILCIA